MNILDKIMDYKKEELVHFKHKMPLAELKKRVRDLPNTQSLASALKNPRAAYAIIAECKRKSPSKGILRNDYHPVRIARDYEENGATALSILTDSHFFGGKLDHLRATRGVVRIPLLRKDFLFDPYQVYAAREAGADAILLIAACLEENQLEDQLGLAKDLGLEVLVEVHGEEECDLASSLGFEIIGVNNRDLKSFKVDLATSERLFPRIPVGRLKISESGLDSIESLTRLKAAGADGFLIGEAFMKAKDPGEALKDMLSLRAERSNL